MPVRNEPTFEAVSANYDNFVTYMSVLRGYEEGKVGLDTVRRVAHEIVDQELTDNPNRELDLETIARTDNPQELADYVTGGQALYDNRIGKAFSEDLEGVVDSTPQGVLDELVKILPNVKPKVNVSPEYEDAKSVHLDYHEFSKRIEILQSKEASEGEKKEAMEGIAGVINDRYDRAYMVDGQIMEGYEPLVNALKKWTKGSQVKIQLGIQKLEESLSADFETAVNGDIKGYLLGAVGKKIVQEMYQMHFQSKAQKEAKERQDTKRYNAENDLDVGSDGNPVANAV
ncbi:hypothetical protein GOV12_08075 [Candidatus Pacearchaeota archaeon]|nr:hypothetical protein [Candidatus Pacearchaeota archaeon]